MQSQIKVALVGGGGKSDSGLLFEVSRCYLCPVNITQIAVRIYLAEHQVSGLANLLGQPTNQLVCRDVSPSPFLPERNSK